MGEFKKFHFTGKDDLKETLQALSLDLPFADEPAPILSRKVSFGGHTLKNALSIHPMEGCDGEADGSPSELVMRRYERFASGGSGLLWVEACAVCQQGRANPRQLYMNEENKENFRRLVALAREKAEGSVYLVLQLTHSGRYAKPYIGAPALIAVNNPHLDPFLPKDHHIMTDDEIRALEDEFVTAAKLAKEVGFDAVDVKACHRYLNNELLSAYTRPGEYGGSFENRTRFFMNVVDKIRAAVDIDITARVNAYDEIPHPYGFGVDADDFHKRDLAEIQAITKMLYDRGVRILNVTGGNPYFNPHVNRPYDTGTYTPPFHQLEHVYKLLDASRQIKKAVPGMTIIATGLTWLRELAANVAAGCIEDGWFDIAGFGRQAFAYPDFADDIVKNGGMQRKKCCTTCSMCTTIMRDGGCSGCVVRDAAVYGPIYRKGREGKPTVDASRIREHI